MKTALDCLMFELNRRMDIIQKETTELREDMINTFFNDLGVFYQNEKDQIIEAHFEGAGGHSGENSSYTKAEQYFNQTFLSNETTTKKQND